MQKTTKDVPPPEMVSGLTMLDSLWMEKVRDRRNIQPQMKEPQMAMIRPTGPAMAAFLVSSAMCAEVSYPVMAH